jgi:hypothetical protein
MHGEWGELRAGGDRERMGSLFSWVDHQTKGGRKVPHCGRGVDQVLDERIELHVGRSTQGTDTFPSLTTGEGGVVRAALFLSLSFSLSLSENKTKSNPIN